MDARTSIRAVLFDLDDTLFDHRASARAALRCVHQMEECFRALEFTAFEHAHARCLEAFHARVVLGELSVDAARLGRFRYLYIEAGVEPSEEQLCATAARYRAEYMTSRQPVEGAARLLATLKPHVRIGIVSNNVVREQENKVRLCGFDEYVSALVISEEAGVAKPDPAIFRIALDRLGCDASHAVMIGDSWTMDIEGARAAGIRAIWFNRTGQPMPEGASDVVEVTALAPIEPVLSAIFQEPRPEILQCASA